MNRSHDTFENLFVKETSHRNLRLAEQVKQTLAERIARIEFWDPPFKVTITYVKVSPDLCLARVFFLPFGAGIHTVIQRPQSTMDSVTRTASVAVIPSGEQAADALHALQGHSHALEDFLFRSLRLKRRMKLIFMVDTDFEKAIRITAKLREMEEAAANAEKEALE